MQTEQVSGSMMSLEESRMETLESFKWHSSLPAFKEKRTGSYKTLFLVMSPVTSPLLKYKLLIESIYWKNIMSLYFSKESYVCIDLKDFTHYFIVKGNRSTLEIIDINLIKNQFNLLYCIIVKIFFWATIFCLKVILFSFKF